MSTLDDWAALDGKVAIVTGAAGGIGRGIALAYASLGMRLVTCDQDAAALAALESDIGGAGVLAAAFDIRDHAALAALFARLDSQGVVADVLVNVVGGTFQAPFLDTRPKGWQALVDLNFGQVLASTQLAAARMVERGAGGSIIHITTIEAHRGAPGYAVYAGLKSAVEGFGRSLAVELGPAGIRVNSIAPDYVLTDGTVEIEARQGRAPIGPAEAAAIVPLGRLATAQDVAGCAVFLASGLSAFVTGGTLHPDGGALAVGRWALADGIWSPRFPNPEN